MDDVRVARPCRRVRPVAGPVRHGGRGGHVPGRDGAAAAGGAAGDAAAVPGSRPGYEQGLSWTTSFERAHWFATRLGWAAGTAHRIWEMDAPRESVLASFHATRGEHEYALDARRLDPDGMREVFPEEWEYLLTATEGHTAP